MRVEGDPVGLRTPGSAGRVDPIVRFLLHGAERSGPPIYVLRLLRAWAARRPALRPQVVIARPGPLAEEIGHLAPTRIARLDRRSPERMAERVLLAAQLRRPARRLLEASVRARVGHDEPTLTVVNGATAPTVELLAALNPTGPVVTVAHELSTGWFANLDASARTLLRSRTTAYLAVSEAVRCFLVDRLHVSDSAVTVIPPPVDGRTSSTLPNGSTDGPRLVAGMGVTDWRKSPETWLRVAAAVRRHRGWEHLRFVWAGGERTGSRAGWPLEHEMEHLALREHVTFLGDVADPWGQLGSADVMVSTAREDAFPLACAEAIARGIPVIGFDVDGIGEMVRASGCGVVVPYPDEIGLSDAVVEVLGDAGLRAAMADRGRCWASQELDTSVVASRVEHWLLEQVR